MARTPTLLLASLLLAGTAAAQGQPPIAPGTEAAGGVLASTGTGSAQPANAGEGGAGSATQPRNTGEGGAGSTTQPRNSGEGGPGTATQPASTGESAGSGAVR